MHSLDLLGVYTGIVSLCNVVLLFVYLFFCLLMQPAYAGSYTLSLYFPFLIFGGVHVVCCIVMYRCVCFFSFAALCCLCCSVDFLLSVDCMFCTVACVLCVCPLVCYS